MKEVLNPYKKWLPTMTYDAIPIAIKVWKYSSMLSLEIT